MNLLALSIPIASLQIYDRIIPHKSLSTLGLLMSAVLLASGIDCFLRILRSYVTGWEGARFAYHSYVAALQGAIRAPLDEIEAVPLGEHMDRLASVDRIREFHVNQLPLLKVDLPFAGLFLIILAMIGGTLALIPMALIFICGSLTLASATTLHDSHQSRTDQDDRRQNFILDTLSGLPTIKALGLETAMQRRYERLMGETAQISSRTITAAGLSRALGTLVSESVTITMAIAGAIAVIKGSMTIGQMAASTMLAGRILPPVLRGLGLWTQYQSIRIAEDRYNALVMPTLATDRPAASPAADPATPCAAAADQVDTIALQAATIGHPGSDPLFVSADLTLHRGEVIALIGPNGCGKSTLLACLGGELGLQAGVLRYNGEAVLPAPDAPHASAVPPGKVAIIAQRPTLFSGTVLENLTGFQVDRNLEAALTLAAEIGLDRVFAAIPDGYEYRVGDEISQRLPMGVIQAIAIVRALVENPAFILFDAANSALDTEMDKRLRALLAARSARCGLLLTSYRPSLLSLAGRGYACVNQTLVPLADQTAIAAAQRSVAGRIAA